MPVGDADNDEVITPSQAEKIIVNLKPRMVIPTHFTDTNSDNFQAFIKEVGDESPETDEKLTVKSRDLSDKENSLFVVKPQT